MNRVEQLNQVALFRWATFVTYNEQPLKTFLHHIPNGGGRSRVEAAILKGMGVLPGVPDVHLPIPANDYCGLYVEMKALGEKLSETQRSLHEAFRSVGNKVVTCFTWEEAAREILLYLQGAAGVTVSRAVIAA